MSAAPLDPARSSGMEMVGHRPAAPRHNDQLHGPRALANVSVRVTKKLHLKRPAIREYRTRLWVGFCRRIAVFGFLADRWRIYLLYPAVLTCWSLMGVASGLSHGYPALLVCRTLLGFFEAGHWPCALKTTFALLNEKDRTMGNSVLQSGASIGAVITPQI